MNEKEAKIEEASHEFMISCQDRIRSGASKVIAPVNSQNVCMLDCRPAKINIKGLNN